MKNTNKYLCSCLLCKTEVFNCGLKNHYDSEQCKIGTTFVKKWKSNTTRDLTCEFCNFVGKNMNSISQHEIRCVSNPKKIDLSYLNSSQNFYNYREKVTNGEIKHLNQFSKAKELGLPKPEISTETRNKISKHTTIQNEIRWSDPNNIELQSQRMRKAVENYPESYSESGNRGRVKRIMYNGISFQGSWELKFYKWCELNNIDCGRYKGSGFEYQWNGIRRYFPDFFLPKYNVYVEVKGFETERDHSKWKEFPHTLIVIRKKEIKEIEKNIFKLLL